MEDKLGEEEGCDVSIGEFLVWAMDTGITHTVSFILLLTGTQVLQTQVIP